VSGCVIVFLLLLVKFLRPFIYDSLIVELTKNFYEKVLLQMSDHQTLLDVGVGTGTALIYNTELLKKKDIHVTGIDYDSAYIKQCNQTLKKEKLTDFIQVKCMSIYDYRPGDDEEFFDAGYFSSSLMLMPDPVKALQHVMSFIKPGGCIYITQTFFHKRYKFIELGKPLLKYLTTIDFGKVTYPDEFNAVIKKSGLEVDKDVVLGNASLKRSFRMVVLKRKKDD